MLQKHENSPRQTRSAHEYKPAGGKKATSDLLFFFFTGKIILHGSIIIMLKLISQKEVSDLFRGYRSIWWLADNVIKHQGFE